MPGNLKSTLLDHLGLTNGIFLYEIFRNLAGRHFIGKSESANSVVHFVRVCPCRRSAPWSLFKADRRQSCWRVFSTHLTLKSLSLTNTCNGMNSNKKLTDCHFFFSSHCKKVISTSTFIWYFYYFLVHFMFSLGHAILLQNPCVSLLFLFKWR